MELLILDEKYRQIVTLIKEVIFSDIISDDYIINEVYDENWLEKLKENFKIDEFKHLKYNERIQNILKK